MRHVVARCGEFVHDHDDPLAPVIENSDFAEQHDDRVGVAEIIRWRVRESFHLSHHVVAEVANEAPRQWRQVIDGLTHERRHEVINGGQHAGIGSNGVGEGPRRRHLTIARDKLGQRASTDEGVATPALTAFYRFEQESGSVANDGGERCHRRESVGHEFGSDGHHGIGPVDRPHYASFGATSKQLRAPV